jgi:hypothetical protein
MMFLSALNAEAPKVTSRRNRLLSWEQTGELLGIEGPGQARGQKQKSRWLVNDDRKLRGDPTKIKEPAISQPQISFLFLPSESSAL